VGLRPKKCGVGRVRVGIVCGVEQVQVRDLRKRAKFLKLWQMLDGFKFCRFGRDRTKNFNPRRTLIYALVQSIMLKNISAGNRLSQVSGTFLAKGAIKPIYF